MGEEGQSVYTPGPNAVDITTEKDGGVLKEIKKEGSGEASPLAGDEVYVHYVGTLLNGDKFDSSRDRKEQFQFTLGRGKVIKAWDLGVATMKQGEISVLTCKPEYAYGEMGAGEKIPGNATLVFEVELFSWKGEDISADKDQGVLRSKIKDGEGFESPNDGATCKIHMVGSYEGRIFDDREVEFEHGEGLVKGVPIGVEMALKKMNQGEVARLVIKSQYGYGSQGKEEFSIPPGATLQYDVTLEAFEKVKEKWEMSKEEKFDQAGVLKNKGTNYFKGSNFVMAKSFYEKAIELIKDDASDEEGEKEDVADATMSDNQTLALACYLNAAMCCIKLNESIQARDFCDSALKIDKKNEKALYRRGTACMNMADYDLAIKDYKSVLAIAPENTAAKNQIALANRKIKEAKEKEKKTFAGMFQKFAEIDAKKEAKKVEEEPPVAVENGTANTEENSTTQEEEMPVPAEATTAGGDQ